ncbi:hypothetical protein [Klebsiella quasipneumoniae]|uniref:hypothetical protein n=1 Tax=Klebsiella quasipneumoniae TaxID=1463165 RepID=UPI00188312E2|nr:hypothetical protein [Klebsiella quasipneumoniae]
MRVPAGVTASAGLSASAIYRPGKRSATGGIPSIAERSEQEEDILAGAEANDKKYR